MENGDWEQSKDEVQRILTNPDLAVGEYERWWKDTSEKARQQQEDALLQDLGDESDDDDEDLA
jgi:hypothetical protein